MPVIPVIIIYDWDTQANILEGNWHTGSLQFDNSPTTSLFEDEDHFPGLPIGMDSDSDSQAGSSSSSSSDGEGSLVSDIMDFDADDELEERDGEESEDLDEENQAANHNMLGKWDRLRRWVLNQIVGMYATRYELPRDGLPRGPSYLHHILTRLKTEREDHFRESLRVNPTTFDALVTAIEDDPIFTSNSNHSQMAIEEQLAITLYRFGHDGNASGLQAVANWAGVGKGTVALVTRRVMTAILRPEFMKESVRWPTDDEKEDAKVWVEQHSCHAWRGGWCFVDGTLVPLATRPAWYGESYFDRKNRYSLNFQVCYYSFNNKDINIFSQIVSLPNLQIIDFSFGHTGSTHDASAWEATRLAQDREGLMEENEWVWADSAYPVNILRFQTILSYKLI
jgi:hypothetical protein